MIVRYKAIVLGIVATGLGLLSPVFASNAIESNDASPSCREVTRKIAVYPRSGNPSKSLQAPRFEKRMYQVCDGKVVPSSKAQAVANRL
jgi:hypothetical protein